MRLLSPAELPRTLAILTVVTVLAAEGERVREISLPLPANIMELPKLQTRRHVVWQPTGWEDMTYCHSPMICWWQGRLFAAWHVAKRWEPFYREFDAPFKGVRPGYENPDAIVHDGTLYVVYSVARERVELTVVDLTKLPSSQ